MEGVHTEGRWAANNQGRASVEQLAEMEVVTDIRWTDDDEWLEGSPVWFLCAVCPLLRFDRCCQLCVYVSACLCVGVCVCIFLHGMRHSSHLVTKALFALSLLNICPSIFHPTVCHKRVCVCSVCINVCVYVCKCIGGVYGQENGKF